MIRARRARPARSVFIPALSRVKPLTAYTTRRPRHLADLRTWDVALLPEPTPPDDPWPIYWHGPCRVTAVIERGDSYHVLHEACHERGCRGHLHVTDDARFHGARVLDAGDGGSRRLPTSRKDTL